ncbi:MAG: hypothetical protein DMF60_10895 [Acidobacteria bacterium]|nr:MAG: hypothetical protein DMF60_10895 [Acidobacteriota bacterium]
MRTPSTFFATFSLRELVGDADLDPSNSAQCGLGGTVGGSIGGSTGYRGSGPAHCHKSESFLLPIAVSENDKFNERQFIESLKANLEKLIIDNSAVITRRGDIEGSFHSSEFYFEYKQEDLQGRIVLSGTLSVTAYRLRADLEERSEGGFNIDERSDGSFSFADAFQMMKPEGDYYVVAFARGDPLAQDNKLHEIGIELIKGSMERIRQSMHQEGLKDWKSAEMWRLARFPQHIERLLADKDLEHKFEVPEEYNGYEKVFFLNDAALKMYSEGGIRLETLKKVSSTEMPRGCINRTLRDPYKPRH